MLQHPDITDIERTGYPSWMRDEPETVYCDYCGDELISGTTYYRIRGENICESCLRHYEEVVE